MVLRWDYHKSTRGPISMVYCKRDVNPLLTHQSYISRALSHRIGICIWFSSVFVVVILWVIRGFDPFPYCTGLRKRHPDHKVHGANMGSTWVLWAPDGPHVGPMNLAIRTLMPWCQKSNPDGYRQNWSAQKQNKSEQNTNHEQIHKTCPHYIDLPNWI